MGHKCFLNTETWRLANGDSQSHRVELEFRVSLLIQIFTLELEETFQEKGRGEGRVWQLGAVCGEENTPLTIIRVIFLTLPP